MFRTQFDKDQKLWRGTYDPALFIPSLSVGRIIQYALRMNGKRVAQVIHSKLHIRRNDPEFKLNLGSPQLDQRR